MPHWRKIVVDDQDYTYRVGKSGVVLRKEEGKLRTSQFIPFPNLGYSHEEMERGRWKGYATFTPKDLAEYIKTHKE